MSNQSQYRGRLIPAQAAEGIRAAVQNAKHLLADAELLLENKRWSRAFALATLAIEELGKEEILRELLLVKDDAKSLREGWKQYRSHVKKNRAWIIPPLIDEGAERVDDILPYFTSEEPQHSLDLELMKQTALYTNVYGKCTWASPSDAINQQQAQFIVSVAKRLAEQASDQLSTQAGLELYVKHLGPVYGKSVEKVKVAMLNYLREANKTGLLSDEGLKIMTSQL